MPRGDREFNGFDMKMAQDVATLLTQVKTVFIKISSLENLYQNLDEKVDKLNIITSVNKTKIYLIMAGIATLISIATSVVLKIIF